MPSGRREIRRAKRASAAVALAACTASLLSACIPILVPPTHDSISRGNVPKKVPPELLAGKSSRTDVLLTLGEPDGRGPEDSWFTYASTRTWAVGGVLLMAAYGGEGLLGGMGGSQSGTRLLINFDDAGLVTGARVDRHTCPGGALLIVTGSSNKDVDASSKDCLDPTGEDIRGVRQEIDQQVDALYPDHGGVIARYDRALVVQHPYPGCKFPHTMYFHTGPVFVTAHALIQPRPVGRSGAAEPTVLPFNEVEQVLPLQRHNLVNFIVLQRKDHVCLFLRTFGTTTLKETREQILKQIRALPSNSLAR